MEETNETIVVELELKIIKNIGNKQIRLYNPEAIKKDDLIAIYINGQEINPKNLNLIRVSGIIKIRIELYNQNSLAKLFKDCEYFVEIKCTEFKGKNIIDMSEMFSGCTNLIKLDIFKIKTGNATDMSHMLHGCSSLKIFNHDLNTSKVENMSYMFYDCSSLEQLNISNFDTKNVTDMSYMFGKCSKLKELSLLHFETENVKYMSYMFYECSSLRELNLKYFYISKVEDKSHMFENCEQLKKLNFPTLKLKSNEEINQLCIFYNCKNLNIDNFVEKINNDETHEPRVFIKESDEEPLDSYVEDKQKEKILEYKEHPLFGEAL